MIPRAPLLVLALATAAPALAAELGKPAPDFSLPDLDGKTVRLSDLRGKVVVLEWFNPECPFVNKAHTVGSLVGAGAPGKLGGEGVVWLAVNSAAPGKQGQAPAVNRAAAYGCSVSYGK